MIKTILEGRKSQTRRIKGLEEINISPNIWQLVNILDGAARFRFTGIADAPDRIINCPYSKPGDRLWVRETWGLCREVDNQKPALGHRIFYKASGCCKDGLPAKEFEQWPVARWRPSIHMPRWASRITLEIVSVRVERVQKITEEDARAEGVGHGFQCNSGWPDYQHIEHGICTLTQDSARMSFATLWDSINFKRGYEWSKNPWVWVIKFGRIT